MKSGDVPSSESNDGNFQVIDDSQVVPYIKKCNDPYTNIFEVPIYYDDSI